MSAHRNQKVLPPLPLLLLLAAVIGSCCLDLVQARQAPAPPEDVQDIVKNLNHLNLNQDELAADGPPCLLDLQKDFPRPNELQPLYLVPDSNRYWLPNARGQLEIPRGAQIELHCMKSFANSTQSVNQGRPTAANNSSGINSTQSANATLTTDITHGNQSTAGSNSSSIVAQGLNSTLSANVTLSTTITHSKQSTASTNLTSTGAHISLGNVFTVPVNTRTIRPRCLHDKSFLWQGEKYEFRQFRCQHSALYVVEPLNEKCPPAPAPAAAAAAEPPSGQLYRVGYNVTANGRFVETMRVCHDDAALRSVYVHHQLLPASIHFQKSVKRLNFSSAGHFPEHNLQHYYSQYNQMQQAAVLLHGQHSQYFNNNSLFLARGHLAAKADFIYATQQRATFNFLNVAPQWQGFNGGQWAALEDAVRRHAAEAGLQLDCYTGTWGIMQLPSPSPDLPPQDFYLARDANNNGLLPVPRLYYRIVVHAATGRGIALVGVNNPFASIAEVKESHVICQDIREEVPWLRWIRNKSVRKGYLYACQVPEFVQVVGHLPPHLLNVTDILR